MNTKKLITTGIFTLISIGTMNAQKKLHLDKTKPIEERIDLLMKQMTLEEKVGQMNQDSAFKIFLYSLGGIFKKIPLYCFWVIIRHHLPYKMYVIFHYNKCKNLHPFMIH